MLSRLFALPCSLLLALLILLPTAPAHAAGLPGLLNGSNKAQPQAEVPLGQSLDEVIKTLENDQQRTQLLSDLKKLRAATQKAQPAAEQGVLGLIGSTLSGLEQQFSGSDSPLGRWSDEVDQAKLEDAQIGYDAAVTPEARDAAKRAALNRGDVPFATFTDGMAQ